VVNNLQHICSYVILNVMFQRFIIFWNNFSLKKALALVLILSLFLSVPVVFVLQQRENTLFSFAGDESSKNVVDESLIPYPSNPPVVINVVKFYGRPGDSVLIYGDNFGDARKESQIMLNNEQLPVSLINYWSDKEVEFSLPSKNGLFNVSVLVNGKESTWFGKIDIYGDLTVDSIQIDTTNNIIKVSQPYSLDVYTATGKVDVMGTDLVNIVEKNIPLDFLDSGIIYVKLVKGGISVPFKVEEVQ